MDFFKRICLTLGLLSAILFVPSTGWSLKIDPYAFTTVLGTVFFEYEHDNRTEQESAFEEKTSTFRQDYGLSIRGNLLSRVLITYDAAFTFERESLNTNFTKSSNNNFYFDLSTTLLPMSRIPLTLFGSRSNSSTSTDNRDIGIATTNTTVGLNWSGKFRVLPIMNFNITRNVNSVGGGNVNKDTRIFYNADKKYGPTSNRFRYTGTFRDDSTGNSTSSSNLGFNNTTRLSSHSSFDLGFTRDVSDTANLGATKLLGLTMGLTSQPSRFFNQSHNVSYFRTDAQDSSYSGTTYSGSMRYDISRKIAASLSLGLSKVFSETLTSSQDSTSTNAASNLSYKLTDHWYTSQLLSFTFTESSNSDPGIANLSDRKLLNAINNINYHRSFSFVSFAATYGLGYLYDSSISLNVPGGNGGQAITHNGTLRFSKIDFNRFFFFNTGASFRRVLKTTSGTVNANDTRINASFVNRFWTKYIQINGSFSKYDTKGAVDAIEEKAEATSLRLSSSPISGSSVALNVQHLIYFSDFTGFSNSNSGSVSVGYGRNILGGRFSGSVVYSMADRTYSGGSDLTRTNNYRLSYEKNLLRRVMWRFNASRTETKVEEFVSDYTTMINTAVYRLRSWSLSATHTYSIQKDSSREYRENRILFRIGRQFMRKF